MPICYIVQVAAGVGCKLEIPVCDAWTRRICAWYRSCPSTVSFSSIGRQVVRGRVAGSSNRWGFSHLEPPVSSIVRTTGRYAVVPQTQCYGFSPISDKGNFA